VFSVTSSSCLGLHLAPQGTPLGTPKDICGLRWTWLGCGMEMEAVIGYGGSAGAGAGSAQG